MNIELTILISIISVSAAIFFGIKSYRRAERQVFEQQKEEAAADAANNTAILVKLETINVGVTEIKGEIQSMKSDVKELSERLVVVEQSTKSAHNRLDEHIEVDRRRE